MTFWSALGSIGSTILGTFLGGKQQQSYNQQNMAIQNTYNRNDMKYAQQLANESSLFNQNLMLQGLQASPGALREGMENAGFNPILAYSSGSFSNATSPGASQALGSGLPSASMPDYANSITNAVQMGLNKRQQRNQDLMTLVQSDNVNADSELKREMAVTEQYKQMLTNAQTVLTNIDSQLRSKEVSWYDKIQLREDRKVLLDRMKTMALQTQASASLQNARVNTDTYNSTKRVHGEILNRQNKWEKEHPFFYGAKQIFGNIHLPTNKLIK